MSSHDAKNPDQGKPATAKVIDLVITIVSLFFGYVIISEGTHDPQSYWRFAFLPVLALLIVFKNRMTPAPLRNNWFYELNALICFGLASFVFSLVDNPEYPPLVNWTVTFFGTSLFILAAYFFQNPQHAKMWLWASVVLIVVTVAGFFIIGMIGQFLA